MDVILINGIGFTEDNIVPQLGLLSLKNVLKAKYEVEIISFDGLNKNSKLIYSDSVNDNINMFVTYLLNLKTPIIGFYTICNTYPLSIEIARRIKIKNNRITILFGGPQASLTAKQTLQTYSFVDVVAAGEGEKYITTLIDRIMGDKNLEAVPNIFYRLADGSIKKNNTASLITGAELSRYTVLNIAEYEKLRNGDKVNFIQNIEAGRGCPYGCTFCSTSIFWGRNFRVKDVDSIISELRYFYTNYNIKKFRLEHDLFTANKKYVMEFCQKLTVSDMNIIWGCSSRIDLLDEGLMKALKDSGCNAIYIGFETGSQDMQYNLNKNITVDSADKKLLALHGYGFDLTISFIYGFPDERSENLRDTIKLIEFLYCNDIGKIQLHKFIPLPVTVETNKVINDLYFDPTDIDISIFQKSHFNEDIYNIIKENKYIHSCFYTFPSRIRSKYKHLDILITCFSLSFNMFKLSIKYLITNIGILTIYLDSKIIIEECYEKMQSLSLTENFDSNCTNQYLFKLFFAIADYEKKQNTSQILNEINNYEHDLFYFTYHSNELQNYKEYNVDIFSAVKNHEIPKRICKKCKVKFVRKNKIVTLSRCTQK